MERNVDELLEVVKLHNASYRAGKPIVPDSVYDREVEMLRELDPDNDWFKTPEPVEVKVRRKSTLPLPMKSLEKVKCLADLKKWADGAGLTQDDWVTIMPKYDGLSLLCNEKTGEAWSRGGSENEGQDCTEHLMANGAKHDTFFSFTYGEFVFSVASWQENFKDRINPDTEKPYKSPRNLAAGLLNRDEPSTDLRYVTYYRYGTDPETVGEYTTFFDLMSDMCDTFSQASLFTRIQIKDLDEQRLMDYFKKWRKIYYMDGLVIYVDTIRKWNALGRKQTSGNPNYAIAYKHPDFADSFETTVKGITWKVSKSGALKPVVDIETVDTGDCAMDSPTGYNAGWIHNMEIAKGASVIVTRSGGVIPKILETLRPAWNTDFFKLWESMDTCPTCGGKTEWDDKHIELYCTNPLCPGMRLAKIVFFYSIAGAENMGEETIAKMYNAGYNSLNSILHIQFDELLKIETFGEVTANIIMENNAKILKGLDLPTLMQASDQFNGIGKVKAQQILATLEPEMLEAIYRNESVFDWTPSQETYDGLPKTMQAFWDGIPRFKRFVEVNGLTILPPTKVEVNANGKCKGMAVCFSGVRDAAMEARIVAEGGSIVTGVSKKTTHLIVKDKNGTSSKIFKAKGFGIPILNIDEVQF